MGYPSFVGVQRWTFSGILPAERWVKKMGMSVTPSNGVPSPTR